jgi:hypothetical protein
MVSPTYVDTHGRPRIKKSLTTWNLSNAMGLPHLRRLTAREGVGLAAAFGRPDLPSVDLDDPQHEKLLQYALFFSSTEGETPLVACVRLRIVPVLRHIGEAPVGGGEPAAARAGSVRVRDRSPQPRGGDAGTSYRRSALAKGSPLRRAYVIRSRTSLRVRGR